MQIQVADNIRYCCGVGEVFGILNTKADSAESLKQMILSIAAVYVYKQRKGVYIFEDVDRLETPSPMVGGRARALAEYITVNKLGTAVLCPPTVNPNSGNTITVMAWVVNRQALEEFFSKHEPKSKESDWTLIQHVSEETLRQPENRIHQHYTAFRKQQAPLSPYSVLYGR